MSIAEPPRMKREKQKQPTKCEQPAAQPPTLGLRTTFLFSLVGMTLFYLSFSPFNFWPLAWLAPVPWLWLAMQPKPLGRHGYMAVWLASTMGWLALLWGVNQAHILLVPGWLVLASYVASYLPLFIGLTRWSVHSWRWPIALAAPVIWIGLELARGYVATGFSLCLLAQSQVHVPMVLQIADTFGAYGPGFVMMLASAALTVWFLRSTPLRERIVSNSLAALAVAATLLYGSYRLDETLPPDDRRCEAMLVQGCIDTVMPSQADDALKMATHYEQLTFENLRRENPVDLVVWPESAFARAPAILFESKTPPEGDDRTVEEYEVWTTDHTRRFQNLLDDYASAINKPKGAQTSFLVGGSTWKFSDKQSVYNSATLIAPDGQVASRYLKNHLVMFGEYVPLADWFPFIQSLTPIHGMSRGAGPEAFLVARMRFSPSICFEDLVPHLIRRHVNELAAKGEETDVLINTTNDGWFYGTSLLDRHFEAAILRTIENRKPLLIAANTGISGVIDSCGRVEQRAPNHETKILFAEVRPDGRVSWYRTLGDWPAAFCTLIAIAALVQVIAASRRKS